ncbi:MAG: feruloyl-CoA synthase [Gemmatimonadetes bacterium]|nr:feruloyl-CoA synthase [Gemmatimonadota bacterium]
MAAVLRDPDRLFARPAIAFDRRGEGGVLRSTVPLEPYPDSICHYLDVWAARDPERPFLLERGPSGEWSGASYGEARGAVRRLAGGLLRAGLGPTRPVAILSDNSVEQGLLTLAAMYVGVPVVPISPSYSVISRDHAKLKAVIDLVRPGMVFVEDHQKYRPALEAIRSLHDGTVVVGTRSEADGGEARLGSLGGPDEEVDQAAARVGPDTVAKLLFTSGSTGEPKGVINTQRMLSSNQQARAQVWPFLAEHPPIMVDWLPWSHTFGANHNFNMVLRHGGTLYLDGGRPAPGLFDRTVANLADVRPTLCFNVPRGYDMLVGALGADSAFRSRFFERLQVILYAAAALPQHLWDALGQLAERTVGQAVPMVSAWGATETAPMVTDCHFLAAQSGVIGVPVPGCQLKLVAAGGKLEARVKGPNVTPGYWRRPDLTAEQFDDEGYYRIGDAVKFVDPDRPEAGLLFDGRVAEDFKLDSGTWVNVGVLRVKGIEALSPVGQDIVVAGHDRSRIGFLVVPNLAGCRALAAELPGDAPLAAVLAHPAVRGRVAAGLAALRDQGGGTSTFATRALLLEEPLSIDGGEITDKGYVNQGAVLRRRPALVAQLYREAPLDPAVIEIAS